MLDAVGHWLFMKIETTHFEEWALGSIGFWIGQTIERRRWKK